MDQLLDATATNVCLNDDRNRARIKRNQSITRMLIGIIVIFLICHTGKVLHTFQKVKNNNLFYRSSMGFCSQIFAIIFYSQIVISIYEVILNLLYEDTKFQPWARHLIVVNSLMCTINSSCNFAFYCGDVVFRECLSTISLASCRKADLLSRWIRIKKPSSSQLDIEMEPIRKV